MDAANAREASIWQTGLNGHLTLKYATNLSRDDLGDFSLKPGEGISGAAVLSRKTIRISDAWSHHQHDRNVDRIIEFRTRSMISAPIIYNDKIYGVINLINHATKEQFPGLWEDIMTAVGVLYAASLVQGAGHGESKPVKAFRPVPEKEQTVIVGISQAIQKVLSLSVKAAASSVPVLIYGETGTGKELCARRIHENMHHRNGPFLSINCAAINETILESELFGHVKGAFSGASTSREGKFMAASGGTLLLDEIGEMSLPCQAKILRALQEKKVMPVGSDRETAYDARIIAATNTDLERLIAQGKFRRDLYFRLCGLELRLPSLRERINDIPLLVDYFLQQQMTGQRRTPKGQGRIRISENALKKLSTYPWPGNVRQLH